MRIFRRLKSYFREHPNAVWVLLMIALGVALRINSFNTLEYKGTFDVYRDYIIADHSLKYGDWPAFGPGSALGASSASPFYFYLVTFFMVFENNIVFLGFVNILLQVLFLLFSYLLAKTLFSEKTALLSTASFAILDGFVNQSLFIWQPYIMQLFLAISFYLLAHAYKYRRASYLLASIPLFVLAVASHYAAIIIGPVFLVCIYKTMDKIQFKNYLAVAAAFLISGFALYFRIAINFASTLWQPNDYTSGLPLTFLTLAKTKVYLSMLANFLFTSRYDFFFHPENNLAATIFSLVSLVFIFVYIWDKNQPKFKKSIFVLWGLSAISIVLIGSFSSLEPRIRYLIPVGWMLPILLSEVFMTRPNKYHLKECAAILILAVFIGTSANNLTSLLRAGLTVPDYSKPTEMLSKIIQTINQIKADEGFADLNFFQFRTYYNVTYYKDADERYLVPLEKEFNLKLTKLSETSIKSFEQTNRDDYIFFICTSSSQTDCLEKFRGEENSKYSSLGLIYEIYTGKERAKLYLLKKTNLDSGYHQE